MSNHTLSISSRGWMNFLRVLSLITLFVSAYSLVQAIRVFVTNYGEKDISMLVVVIYLLVTPLLFAASLFFALFVHRFQYKGSVLVLGYAMAVLAAVDNLIYVSIHYANSLSFHVLAGLELICLVICFLYFQNIGGWGVSLCAGILLAACALLQMEELLRYFIVEKYYDFTGYYFAQTLLDVLIALLGLGFVLSIERRGRDA